ncbi:MAG: serine/threonine protein kinase [Synechococcaceae cyanobacterium RL_1_2]|nr:serine/threonine protein kinase [Synechococcaceae cyanobacterium RL_1_2]
MNQTICCLNPRCEQPLNPTGNKFCNSCGQGLIEYLRNRYQPLTLLSDEGGFGRTYLASDRDSLDSLCVIKQLIPQGAAGNTASTAQFTKVKELFQREAQQLKELGEHAQIPALLGFFAEQHHPNPNKLFYLIQQFIDGQPLDKISPGIAWSEDEVKKFLLNILPVLQFIHEKGVIHRDLKPQNIIRRASDQKYVLIDFGASKEMVGSAKTGTKIYTLGYAPYEQMIELKTYPATDLYSLGVTCFHLLTNQDPGPLCALSGAKWVEQWQQQISPGIKISGGLRTVLDRLLQWEHGQRYQSADQVMADLAMIEIPQGTVASSPTKKKNPPPKVRASQPANPKSQRQPSTPVKKTFFKCQTAQLVEEWKKIGFWALAMK